MTPSDDDWSGRLAAAVGRNVKRLREQRAPKLSAQRLADQTAELGHAIPRSVLANLESGRRSYVTLADLFTLAHALDVPPFALIAPLASDERVEVLPGQKLSSWDAVDWFDGNLYPIDAPAGSDSELIRDAYDMRLRYRIAMKELVKTIHRVSNAHGPEREALVDLLSSQFDAIEELRRALERLGVVGIPPLPNPAAVFNDE